MSLCYKTAEQSRSTRTAAHRFEFEDSWYSGTGFAASARLRRRSVSSNVWCDMSAHVSNRKWIVVALLVMVLGGVVWIASRASIHPEFGRIYAAEMVETHTDNWQTRWERGEAMLLSWLHLSQREAPPQHGLQIGPALLGWSLGGHIYMDAPEPSARNAPRWEFALSRRSRLKDVTREELQCEFYGVNDPRGTNVFGPRYISAPPVTRTAWEERAIQVPDGQVFFARLVTDRSTVYVIQLGKWQSFTNASGAHNGRIRAQYVRVEGQLPNPIAPPEPPPAVPTSGLPVHRTLDSQPAPGSGGGR